MTSSGRGMSLVQAFETFGPETGVPAVDRPRREAVRVLRDETVRLLRYKLYASYEAHRDDIVQNVLLGMLKGGPYAHDPTRTDGMVRSFLHKAIRNEIVSLGRRQGRTASDDDRPPRDVSLEAIPPDLLGAHDEAVVDGETTQAILHARSALDAAQEALATEVIPAVARGADGRRATLEDLRAVRDGEKTSDDIPVAPGTLYKRAQRALEACHAWVDEQERAGAVDATQAAALRMVLDELRLRPR